MGDKTHQKAIKKRSEHGKVSLSQCLIDFGAIFAPFWPPKSISIDEKFDPKRDSNLHRFCIDFFPTLDRFGSPNELFWGFAVLPARSVFAFKIKFILDTASGPHLASIFVVWGPFWLDFRGPGAQFCIYFWIILALLGAIVA